MSEAIDVSVVVSTYNRCMLLPAALAGLLAQDTNGIRYEILLVDNNSTDRTRDVVESYRANGATNLHYLFEPKQGVSHGRNTGITTARGPLIAFTDDDIVVGRDWVARIKQAFDEHPEVDFVGGKILPQWETPPPSWLTVEHWPPLALVDYGAAPFYVDGARPVCLLTANAAFRRAALEQVGMFSPDLQRVKDGVGSMEDQELEIRLCRAGRRGLYVPELVVVAPVQADRLTKEYHRRWHRGHGHFSALLREADTEKSQKRLFDVPGYLYRRAFCDWLKLVTRSLRGRRDEAFLYEARLCFFAGFYRQRRADYRAIGRRSAVGELAHFLRSLVSRKKVASGN
jgi:glycosyltransferase involved in cell wall biosynthesis